MPGNRGIVALLVAKYLCPALGPRCAVEPAMRLPSFCMAAAGALLGCASSMPSLGSTSPVSSSAAAPAAVPVARMLTEDPFADTPPAPPMMMHGRYVSPVPGTDQINDEAIPNEHPSQGMGGMGGMEGHDMEGMEGHDMEGGEPPSDVQGQPAPAHGGHGGHR